MSVLKEKVITSTYEHSPLISDRRRSLFPSDVTDSEDSDLGRISPLSLDSSYDQEDLRFITKSNDFQTKENALRDYDIIGVVENDEEAFCTPAICNKNYTCSETMSPVCLSPYYSSTMVTETPKTSPSFNLKTPHDSCSTNTKLPKLARKSLLDPEPPPSKRKLSPSNSPEHTKQIKLDSKLSKVRTTLFPEIEISLSTNKFYCKTEDTMEKVHKREPISKALTYANAKAKSKNKRRRGEINAGVSHKIRKPKAKDKKTIKAALKTAVKKSVEDSAIIDYIKDLKELHAAKHEPHKLIENKENTDEILPRITRNQIKTILPPKIENTLVKNVEIPKKRPVTPELEPNLNKKFFKFSRPKAVVTINDDIKLEVNRGKMSIVTQESPKITQQNEISFDTSDFNTDEPSMSVSANIDNILESLESDDTGSRNGGNTILLEAHKTVSASENSIMLHDPPVGCPANLILSPISQMCDVTSGLALNSPKRVKNLTTILANMPNTANVFNKQTEDERKLFPIFYEKNDSNSTDNKDRLHTNKKKLRKLPENQMLLDAGQKRFGVTQCSECNFLYHMGDAIDEDLHFNYHQAINVLRFYGWKNEKVVADFQDNGRIIQIMPDDSKHWIKRVKDLMELINRELGCYDTEFKIENTQTFLYIKNRLIVGCLVAIPASVGHRMLTNNENEPDMCSETSYPIKCGIARIWVSHNYRQQRIGTNLMEAVKKNFLMGYSLSNADIALSPPTEAGKLFAKSYFKTSNYLVYFV